MTAIPVKKRYKLNGARQARFFRVALALPIRFYFYLALISNPALKRRLKAIAYDLKVKI